MRAPVSQVHYSVAVRRRVRKSIMTAQLLRQQLADVLNDALMARNAVSNINAAALDNLTTDTSLRLDSDITGGAQSGRESARRIVQMLEILIAIELNKQNCTQFH